ncbi:MAG: type-F conjugative transfer system pilin assembly protein TraF [Alphaproteobacteria bacterium]|jgi:conjugal transfer pilus assembly protein TraF|nr:type-F conjugative transfer system pilin assembly protein TraF [Alphaproteobacteria bacterium]MBP9776813.1 type-F conjugative transfer system pilin assembly protein TraF [Alphaproteobacteria bacterium]
MLQRIGLQRCRIKRVKWKDKILYVALSSALPVFFNTSVKATSQPLIQSPQKPQEFVKANSKNSPKIGSSFKLAFFERRAEGWHWYESWDNDKADEEKKKPELVTPHQTPTEEIEAQRKDIEQKLHAAIVEPTRENLIAYIIAQKVLMDQSQRFSESWQQVVMTTPALDETLIHPVDQNARHVYYNERNKELTKHIKALSQEYGLFFFFKKACSYCHHFAPVVKHFTEKHGWSVLAISLDGGGLPEFPYARQDNGIAARLQVTHVPALIAVHPRSGQTIPLAYGLVSESEIERRVELLTRAVDFEGVKK